MFDSERFTFPDLEGQVTQSDSGSAGCLFLMVLGGSNGAPRPWVCPLRVTFLSRKFIRENTPSSSQREAPWLLEALDILKAFVCNPSSGSEPVARATPPT